MLPLDGRRPSVMRHWTLEGRLVDHYSTPDGWRDVLLYALWREDFAATVPRGYTDLARKWVDHHGA